MGFSRQGYWSRLPFPSPGDLPAPGIEHLSPALQADSLPLHHLGSSSGSSRENLFPCLLQLLEAFMFLDSWPPPLFSESVTAHISPLWSLFPLTIPSPHTLPLLLYMLNLGCLWGYCMKNFPGVWISLSRREDLLSMGQTVHTMSHFLYL